MIYNNPGVDRIWKVILPKSWQKWKYLRKILFYRLQDDIVCGTAIHAANRSVKGHAIISRKQHLRSSIVNRFSKTVAKLGSRVALHAVICIYIYKDTDTCRYIPICHQCVYIYIYNIHIYIYICVCVYQYVYIYIYVCCMREMGAYICTENIQIRKIMQKHVYNMYIYIYLLLNVFIYIVI